ncbi:MAG: helix-turn-helix domain-containing protein [Gluconobacter sp.]|uniref:helix-turn-helix domain-containing protein n=1 Tax=Gluconobacter sp. TaxID=1876758 RepID=UPI0039E958A5
MARKKAAGAAPASRPVGRPTAFLDRYCEEARKLCLLGATDSDLADFFDVSERTINAWKEEYPEFLQSIKKGKILADATVAERLYKRATGYEHDAVKIFNSEGQPLIVPYTERYAPDTTAAIFWLKNRQRDKWRDKQDFEHTGADGGPLEFTEIRRVVVDVPKKD